MGAGPHVRAAARAHALEESPGSTDRRWRVTPAGGDPRESATESEPPPGPCESEGGGKGERVRQERTAAPATGTAGQTPPGARPNRRARPLGATARSGRRAGWSLEAAGDSRPRGMAAPRRGDRTRLTGHVAPPFFLRPGRQPPHQPSLPGRGDAAREAAATPTLPAGPKATRPERRRPSSLPGRKVRGPRGSRPSSLPGQGDAAREAPPLLPAGPERGAARHGAGRSPRQPGTLGRCR